MIYRRTTILGTILALAACDAGPPSLIELRLASAEPVRGWEAMAVDEDTVWVDEDAVIADADIAAVQPSARQGHLLVTLYLDEPGGARLRRATQAHIGRPMAMLVEGRIVSAATLQSAIGGNPDVPLTGGIPVGSAEEAEALEARIRARFPAPRPDTHDLLRLAVNALREDLEIDGPVRVHPLLIRRDGPDRPVDPRTGTFNAHDSTSVRFLTMMERRRVQVCRTTPAGACEVETGEVAITLSEPWGMGEDAFGVAAVVRDARGESPIQSYHAIRITAGRRGWEAVDVRPIP